jgi:hypothetical protein
MPDDAVFTGVVGEGDAVGFLEEIFPEHRCYGTGGEERAFRQDPDVVAPAGGEIHIVHGDDDCSFLPCGLPEKREEFRSVAGIEGGRRLVQEKDLWILGEKLRDGHALPFSAGEFHHASGEKVSKAEAECRCRGHAAVLFRVSRKGAHMRKAPEEDDLVHREGRAQQGVLGNEADAESEFSSGELSKAMFRRRRDDVTGLFFPWEIPKKEVPLVGEEPRETAEKGALSAPVGAEERGDASMSDLA